MLSEEARIGMRVKVSSAHIRSDLRGMAGVVEQVYGHPAYRALEVRLENGRCELFWHYELKRENAFV